METLFDITLIEGLIVLCLLFMKHFIVDFPLQAFPYQYENKGTYGHPGGLLHSGLHAIGTGLVLFGVMVLMPHIGLQMVTVLLLALADGFLHYHIDWAKVKFNKKMGWGPTTHQEFWALLGFDQLLHSLTYLLIILMIA